MMSFPEKHTFTYVSAFSLVELSIVLVILGLLVGGVLSGQSLIRASELRAITTEEEKYQTAVHSFRDKYFMLPGDLSNAHQFWGSACGTDTTDAATGCNGDGDGFITLNNAEQVKVWMHLSRAQLVEGNYDAAGTIYTSGMFHSMGMGIPGEGGGGGGSSPGTTTSVVLAPNNTPTSKFPQGSWEMMESYGDVASSSATDLYLTIGSIDTDDGRDSLLSANSLTRSEAAMVDRKMDDGKANSGSVRGDLMNSCNDSSSMGSYGADVSQGGDPNATDCTLNFFVR